jgi:hypothetical protein
MRRGQITLFIILGLVFVIIVSLTLYLIDVQQREQENAALSALDRAPILKDDCEDGTKNGQCGKDRPLQCRNGVMKPMCSDCGCPTNELCNVDGTCKGRAEQAKSNFTFYILPVGYAPDDREFLLRAEVLKAGMFATMPFTDENFVIVENTYPDGDCLTITRGFDRHVQEWLQKQTGHGLSGVRFEDGIPLYSYRIIGISEQPQDEARCGCAHSLMYSPNVFVGGSSCGFSPHVVLHELGHTIGLCDEYDTCVYDETNKYMSQGFGHPCLNGKPTADNSDCTDICCSKDAACCDGRFADKKTDGFFNIMGSGDVPPSRRLNSQTQAVFWVYFCGKFGVCP